MPFAVPRRWHRPGGIYTKLRYRRTQAARGSRNNGTWQQLEWRRPTSLRRIVRQATPCKPPPAPSGFTGNGSFGRGWNDGRSPTAVNFVAS